MAYLVPTNINPISTNPLDGGFSNNEQESASKRRNQSTASLIDLILTIVEIVLDVGMIVAGAITGNPALVAYGGSAIAQTILALAFSTARTIVNVTMDNASGFNIAFDFASAFLPITGRVVGNTKLMSRVAKNFQITGRVFTQIELQNIAKAQTSFMKRANKIVYGAAKKHSLIVDELNAFAKTAAELSEKEYFDGMKKIFDKLKLNKEKINATLQIAKKQLKGQGNWGKASELLEKQFEDYVTLLETGLEKTSKFGRPVMFKGFNLLKAGKGDAEAIIKKAFPFMTNGQIKVLLQPIGQVKRGTTVAISESIVQRALASSEKNGDDLLAPYYRMLETMHVKTMNASEKDILKQSWLQRVRGKHLFNGMTIKNMPVDDAARIPGLKHATKKEVTAFGKKELKALELEVWQSLDTQTAGIFGSFKLFQKHMRTAVTMGAYNTVIRNAIRKLGSRSFNDRWVQKFQLIDANDFGRAPVEIIYQMIRKVIRKKEKFVGSSLYKNFEKGRHVIGQIEQTFLKKGGVLIPPNRYLLGYKIIPIENSKVPSNHHTVLLMFNQRSTNVADPTSKNHGGKKPVLSIISDHDLKLLRKEGVDYYWRVGKRRGWYRNRGGHQAKGGREVSNELALFLMFMPIPALRNVLSIVSNLVENISDMASGVWAKNWKGKAMSSFSATLINRSSRLIFREVLGKYTRKIGDRWILKRLQKRGVKDAATGITQLADERFVEKLIRFGGERGGFEVQRYVGAGLKGVYTKDRNAGLGIKLHVSAKRAKSALRTASLQSAKAIALRSGRVTDIAGRKISMKFNARRRHGEKRKYGQVRRIASAFTPNKSFNARTWGRF